MSEKKKPIGSILLKQRTISSKQLAEALRNHRRGDPPLVSKLTEQGIIREHEALKALSEQSGCPGIDLNQVVVRLADLELIPRQLAEQHTVLPVLVKGNRVFVAMSDPRDERVLQEIEMVTGKKAFPYISLKTALRRVIIEAYDRRDAGHRHYVGSKCSAETLRKAGVEEQAPMDVAAQPPRPPPPPPAAYPLDNSPLPKTSGRAPVDEAPSSQLEHRLRPRSRHQAPITSDAAVVVDDTMAATAGSTPGISFDDPTFRDLEVPPEIAQRPYPAPQISTAVETLLVVDADDDVRGRVASVFYERGYQVVQADRGDVVLQMVRDHNPHVIVLEATLPGVHGFELARQLKSSDRYRGIRIVMTSELYRGWRIAQDLKSTYGVDGFIEKPFKIDDIVHEVERLRTGLRVERETSAEAEPYLQAGIAAYKAGNLEEAVAQLRTGTRVDPLAYKVHFHLGLLYGKAGQLFDGIQELETSLSIRSDFFPALKNLAVLYQNAGFRNKAIEMWERCLAAAPDDETRETIKRLLMAVL